MQRPKKRRKLPIFLLILALAVGGGAAWLMMQDIPAPQAPVEKPLDPQQFLGR